MRLVDVARPMLDRARGDRSRRASRKFVEKGKLTAADARRSARPALDGDFGSTDLADADYIVEAIVEDVEAKQSLFAGLDAIAQTPTSSSRRTPPRSPSRRSAPRPNAPEQRARHALHEPGAADAAGRADSRPGDTSDESMRVASDLCTSARQDARSKRRTTPASSPTAS